MNEVLAKLTNLGYELFGVFIPGFVLALFGILWWKALGALAPLWTDNVIPELTVSVAKGIAESLNAPSGAGVGLVALVVCYFAGHVLLWIARAGKPVEAVSLKAWSRLWHCLFFRIPKPKRNYDANLQRLYDKVQGKFAVDGLVLEWREFYPVAKLYVAENVKTSLVPTYQNKYTLHRSITAAAALLFWVCIASLIAARFSVGASWLTYTLLSILAFAALTIVWNFSASYIYHWGMFANTIITESYSHIFGPKHETKKS